LCPDYHKSSPSEEEIEGLHRSSKSELEHSR
jgi:hypothetical protein